MTGSTIIASVIMLVVLALPAVAAARNDVRSAFARQTGDLSTVFDWQAPKSKGKTNAHVYHGGPKAND